MVHTVERSYHIVWPENNLIGSTMTGIGNTWGWTCVGNFYSLLLRHPVYEADQGKTINMEDSVSAGVCHESEEVPLIIFWVAQCPDTIIMQSEKKSWKRRPQQRIGLQWWRCLSVSHSVTVPAGVLPWYSLSATVAAPLYPVDTNIFTTLDKRLLNHRHQVECKVGIEMPDFSDIVISI